MHSFELCDKLVAFYSSFLLTSGHGSTLLRSPTPSKETQSNNQRRQHGWFNVAVAATRVCDDGAVALKGLKFFPLFCELLTT